MLFRSDVELAFGEISRMAHPDANIIWGAAFDENMDDCISVTVIATGFDEKSAGKSVKNDDLEWDFISKARPVEAAPASSAAGTVVPPSQDNDDYLDVMTYFTKKKD